MTSTSHIYCLVLYPREATFASFDLLNLQQHLRQLGLLGEAFQLEGEQRFKLGESFYQLLSFMGCAPALKLVPSHPDDGKFCHFRFVQLPAAEFRFLREEVRARCPHCRKPGESAGHIQQLFMNTVAEWSCPHCQQVSAIQDINWKHEAGIGRFFIELLDVYPHEVVPTDGLLKTLQSETGQVWDYFYSVN